MPKTDQSRERNHLCHHLTDSNLFSSLPRSFVFFIVLYPFLVLFYHSVVASFFDCRIAYLSLSTRMVSLVGCLLLIQASFSWALAVGHGNDGSDNIAPERTYALCTADSHNTDDALGVCRVAVLALSLDGPDARNIEGISVRMSPVGDCTDATLEDQRCPLYCRILCPNATPDGKEVTEAIVLQYCSASRQWCRITESTIHYDCYEKEQAAKEIMERVDGGNPFGTFTMPATTEDTAVATSAPQTTSSSSTPSPTTHAATATTTKTSSSSSKTGSKTTTAKQSTAPTSSASADIDSASAGSDGGREALIASLSVVSVIAAVSMLALVAALVYVRRLSHRNRDLLQNSAGANAASANHRPDSSGERYETMTVHNATPTVRTSIISNNIPQSHELSPIREQSESSVGGRLSGGSAGGAIGSRSSAEVFDGFGEEINWGGINGGIIIAELPENTPKQK